MKKRSELILIIPAHNEEKRIGPTLQAYHSFLHSKREQDRLDFELVVVLNGCTDNTYDVASELQQKLGSITLADLPGAGKGYAITEGFKYALKTDAELIGFVDADMATSPVEFYRLIEQLADNDGIIASRYMKGATVIPPRPRLKRWGSRIIFEPLVRLLLGISYKDLQCGAKLFKRAVIKKIIHHVTIHQWAFDVELLYVCKKLGFSVKEVPTVWHDQALSKLNTFRGGMRMLSSIVAIRKKHSQLRR